MCGTEKQKEKTGRTPREKVTNQELQQSSNQLTPDWSECLVASSPAAVGAAVLCMSSGWGAPKSKAWRAVHLRGGRLAAATVAVAANTAQGVLRR